MNADAPLRPDTINYCMKYVIDIMKNKMLFHAQDSSQRIIACNKLTLDYSRLN